MTPKRRAINLSWFFNNEFSKNLSKEATSCTVKRYHSLMKNTEPVRSFSYKNQLHNSRDLRKH